jgi:hypothetical protein
VLVLLYVLAQTNRAQWDFSAGGRNTLTPETLAKLRLLDEKGEKVEVYAFTAQRGKEDADFKNRSMKDLLTTMGDNSKLLEWRQVDFDRERLTAERLGVNDYGRVVILRGQDRVDIKDRDMFQRIGKGKDKSLAFIGEAQVSRGLSQLLTPAPARRLRAHGHGEQSVADRGPNGLSDLVASLDIERFDTESLTLLQTGREGEIPMVPDDASVVFIAGPKADLTPDEEDILLDYVGRGGSLLYTLELGTPCRTCCRGSGSRSGRCRGGQGGLPPAQRSARAGVPPASDHGGARGVEPPDDARPSRADPDRRSTETGASTRSRCSRRAGSAGSKLAVISRTAPT